jgi:hypothetical protein
MEKHLRTLTTAMTSDVFSSPKPFNFMDSSRISFNQWLPMSDGDCGKIQPGDDEEKLVVSSGIANPENEVRISIA